MSQKMTGEEFASKVDWEGGLMMATQEYGLSSEALDPEADPELYAAMVAYDGWLTAGDKYINAVLYHLSAYEPDDEE
jgi:hypothetical protein